jgi:hypothetical protein
MPDYDRDEILKAFAKSQGFGKEAANALLASNIAKALGIEAGISAGAAAIGAAIGKGALAGLGLSGPPGWVAFGAIMLVGGLAWAIGSAIQQADNNIDDLIDRLEALDYEGTTVNNQILSWIRALKSYKPALQAPTLGKPEQVAQQSAERVYAIMMLVRDLRQMQQAWPGVKSAVEDWKFLGRFGDVGEAEVTLNQTAQAMEGLLKQLQTEASKATQKTLAELQKDSKQDYKSVAMQVIRLFEQLTAAAGKEPVFDEPGEEIGYNFAVALSKGSEINMTKQQLQENVSYMTRLRDKMLQGMKQLQKKSESKPPISKRALTLGNGEKVVMPDQKGRGGTRKNKPTKSNPVRELVKAMQVGINHLSARYNPEGNRIVIDGIYGPQTSGALVSLAAKYKSFRLAMESQAGLSVKSLYNHSVLRRDPSALRKIYSVVSEFVSKIKNSPSQIDGSAGYREKQQDNTTPKVTSTLIEEIMNKPGDELTDMEIDLVLRNVMRVPTRVRGQEESAFALLKHKVGLSSVSARANFIRETFSSGASGMPKASKWANWGSSLYNQVKREFGNKHKGPYSLL